MDIEIKKGLIPPMDKVLALYYDCCWTAYTDEPKILEKAIKNSLEVLTLWDGEILVGLARTVGDGATICYLQDILILNSYQGKGLGTRLLDQVLADNDHIRQFNLLTEDVEKNRNFYRKLGLEPVASAGCISFMK